MVIELDEIIEKIYSQIHQFLITEVGEDLDQDLIDINLEVQNEKELIVKINLYIELASFSKEDVQSLAEKAIRNGINVADKICPSFLIQFQQK